eukprot:c38571_g1_i1 orf=123-284(+)
MIKGKKNLLSSNNVCLGNKHKVSANLPGNLELPCPPKKWSCLEIPQLANESSQ